MTREDKIKRVFKESLYIGDIVNRNYLLDCIELIQENNQIFNSSKDEADLNTREDIATLFRYYAHNIIKILRQRIPENLNNTLNDLPYITKVNSLIEHELCKFSAGLILDELEPDYEDKGYSKSND